MTEKRSLTPQRMPSFVQAVRERGDSWVYAFENGKPGQMTAATWLAMRDGRNADDARSALTMKLCDSHGRLFQVEQPIFRCGCDGLCDKHPDCPGEKYQLGFPYKRGKT